MSLTGPAFAPPSGNVKKILVLLHGYGADGQDLIALAPALAPHLPDTLFVAPNAPTRIPGAGYEWFNLASYDPNLLRRDAEHAAGLYAQMHDAAAPAASQLHAFLDQLLSAHGLGDQDMILSGFSQGGMMALHAGLRRPSAPAGIISISGAYLGGAEIAHKPPVLLVHGMADDIVPIEAMDAAQSHLSAMGVAVESLAIPGLGHGIDPMGLGRAIGFIKKLGD